MDTFEGGFDSFCRPVIDAFEMLATKLLECLGDAPIKEGLEVFSGTAGFKTTMEGDASRKKALTFEFSDREGGTKRIVCEPHMKLTKSAVDGDSKYYQNRIYFTPNRDPDIHSDILVGHAGEHL